MNMCSGNRHAVEINFAGCACVVQDRYIIAEVGSCASGCCDAHVAHGAYDHDILDALVFKDLLKAVPISSFLTNFIDIDGDGKIELVSVVDCKPEIYDLKTSTKNLQFVKRPITSSKARETLRTSLAAASFMTYYEKWRQVGCANFSEGEFSFEDFEAAARDTFVGTQLLLRGGTNLSSTRRMPNSTSAPWDITR